MSISVATGSALRVAAPFARSGSQQQVLPPTAGSAVVAPRVEPWRAASVSLDTTRIASVDRQARAGAIASELSGSREASASPDLKKFSRLNRADLAAMVFSPNGNVSRDDRDSAQAQLAANDGAYLQQADELAVASGDERVRWTAQVALEQAKGVFERTLPDGEITRLKGDIAARTAIFGEPQAISLRYPNGWSSQATVAHAMGVNPGAARVARAYANALED